MSGFVSPVHVSHSPEGPDMLTSPVNVTIAANGIALKANTPASDHNSARREPPLLPVVQAQQAESIVEPELPSNSPLTNLNSMTATVGNRTILQELALNVATMLRIARRADENLTSLFLRVIATIEAMPPAERLQLEIRAGLKPLKITLGDLAMALRKPSGREAAHLTALAEAPTSSRTAANAATTTYLEEGTESGHTEEALAMRAAARHSAAGQSVFSAESKARPADAQPADAKVLQSHLMTMFEPGEANLPDAEGELAAQEAATGLEWPSATEGASVAEMDAGTVHQDAALPVFRQPLPSADAAETSDTEKQSAEKQGAEAHGTETHGAETHSAETVGKAAASTAPGLKPALPLPPANLGEFKAVDVPDNKAVQDPALAKAAPGIAAAGRDAVARALTPAEPRQPISLPAAAASENVIFSSANLKLDPPAVEKIRNVAQAIAIQAETTRPDQEHPVSEKGEDRRVQTMLTLKGLAEVVIAIPAKAAELLAIVVAEAAAPLPDMAEEKHQVAAGPLQRAFDEKQLPEYALATDERIAENAVALAEEMPIEIPVDAGVPVAEPAEMRAEAAVADEHQTLPDLEGSPLARPDLTQHAVPFAYVQVQPAREDMIEAVEEEDSRDETDEDGENDGDEDGEPRRPRDEYDAIHDPVPEEEEAIVINRDSSEADRAFALYQRMGGF